jgi:hypothetical protein
MVQMARQSACFNFDVFIVTKQNVWEIERFISDHRDVLQRSLQLAEGVPGVDQNQYLERRPHFWLTGTQVDTRQPMRPEGARR